jgi:hypothetical protein
LFFRAGPTRLELATSGVTGQRSSHAPAVLLRFPASSDATKHRPQPQGFTKGPIKKRAGRLEFHPTPTRTTMLDMRVAYPSRCRQVQLFSLSPDCELSEDSGIREVHHHTLFFYSMVTWNCTGIGNSSFKKCSRYLHPNWKRLKSQRFLRCIGSRHPSFSHNEPQ